MLRLNSRCVCIADQAAASLAPAMLHASIAHMLVVGHRGSRCILRYQSKLAHAGTAARDHEAAAHSRRRSCRAGNAGI